MKREIKFRGKYISGGYWSGEGYYVKTAVGDIIVYEGINIDEDTQYRYLVFPESIGHTIGMQDMDGRDIYDNDILMERTFIYDDLKEQEIEVYQVGRVAFSNGRYVLKDCVFYLDCALTERLAITQPNEECPIHYHRTEIIGNTYDNYNLL